MDSLGKCKIKLEVGTYPGLVYVWTHNKGNQILLDVYSYVSCHTGVQKEICFGEEM